MILKSGSIYAKKIRVACLIITYNRINEAKAQMDLIRETWQPMFDSVDIYHEFNGKKNWYPQKYRENFLSRHKSMSHYIGANHMLNKGFKHILDSFKKYDYIIASSSDVWFYDPKKLKKIILDCFKQKYQLATSLWGGMVLNTEFFIITPELAKKVFPLRYMDFINKYKLLRWANNKISILENIFTFKVIRVLKNPNKFYLIPGRRTIWPTNRFYSANFYASHHDPIKRRKDVLPNIKTILEAKLTNMPSLYKFLS